MSIREGRVDPRDTRSYGGVAQRILWNLRRYVERKYAYSRGDILTYEIRSISHAGDDLGDEYQRLLVRERRWFRFVWEPLAKALDVERLMEDHINAALPGEMSILEWLNSHPHLAHETTGGYRVGYWVDWFSIDPAPWSGKREDWLLWTSDEGTQDVEGPLDPIVAADRFYAFDAEYRAVMAPPSDRYVEPDQRTFAEWEEDIDRIDREYADLDEFYGFPLVEDPFPQPFAHGLTARESDDDPYGEDFVGTIEEDCWD